MQRKCTVLFPSHALLHIQFYSDGIYNEGLCSRRRLTHSMLVVGYGTLNGTDYWLLKNRYPCITVLIFAVGILVCVH